MKKGHFLPPADRENGNNQFFFGLFDINGSSTYMKKNLILLVVFLFSMAGLQAETVEVGDPFEFVKDESGNDRDGALDPEGVATYSDNVPGVVSGSFTSVDLTEAVLIGATGYKGITGANPRSVAAWVYPIEAASHNLIAEWGQFVAGGGNRWSMRLESDKLRVEVDGGAVRGTTQLQLNTWHHVAVTFEGTGLVAGAKLFVNGIEEALELTNNNTVDTGDVADVTIGGSPFFDGRYFVGLIDEVGIWSRALSGEEIAALATGAQVSQHSAGLELYYDFELPGAGGIIEMPFERKFGSVGLAGIVDELTVPAGAYSIGVISEGDNIPPTITSLPPELSGSLGLLPENDAPESASAGFVVDRDTTVSVAIATDREVPAWLANHYNLSSLTIDTTAGPFDVWQRDIHAREYVALPEGHRSLAFLGFGPVEDDSLFGFAQTSLDPGAWRLEDHNWRLTAGPGFDVSEDFLFSEVINFDPALGFKLATTLRVPRLQDAGDNAVGLILLGDAEAGIRAEWRPRLPGGGSDLRLVNAANGEILESAFWTGVTPNAIDNDVGVANGAGETVFAEGAEPLAGSGAVMILLSEDFDGDLSGWSSESTNDTDDQWEIGTPASGPQGGFGGSDNVAATRLEGGYSGNSASVLRSPEIDLSVASGATLRFREYMDIDTYWNDLFDCWYHFGRISVRDVDTQDVFELAEYSEEISVWSEREIDLSPFAGRRIVIEFEFFSDHLMEDAGDGWYLDDVQVSALRPVTIESMPELLSLDGSLNGIVTDSDGVDDESGSHLQFIVEDRSGSANEGVGVFVAWDVRASGMEPDWLRNEFTMTDHFVAVSGTRHRLWLREYADGEQVTLGGASAVGAGSLPAGTNNYFVLFGDARSGNETLYTLTAEGRYEEGSWNLGFLLSDGKQTQKVSAVIAESLAAGQRFGVFARHPDAGGQAVTHPPVWEVFDLSMDFLPDPEGFEAWREQHFTGQLDNPGISGPEASPAGDGVKNLIKYALNLSPWETVPWDELFEMRVGEEGDLILVYRERTDIDDIEYVPEMSENLIEWKSGEPHVTKVVLGDEGDSREIEARGSVSPEAQKGFIRLNVRKKE